MAVSSVTELVDAVRKPRSLSESDSRPFIRKSGGGNGAGEKERSSSIGDAAPGLGSGTGRRNSDLGATRSAKHRKSSGSMQRIIEVPEKTKKMKKKPQKKSSRRSFMGYSHFSSQLHILIDFFTFSPFSYYLALQVIVSLLSKALVVNSVPCR